MCWPRTQSDEKVFIKRNDQIVSFVEEKWRELQSYHWSVNLCNLRRVKWHRDRWCSFSSPIWKSWGFHRKVVEIARYVDWSEIDITNQHSLQKFGKFLPLVEQEMLWFGVANCRILGEHIWRCRCKLVIFRGKSGVLMLFSANRSVKFRINLLELRT